MRFEITYRRINIFCAVVAASYLLDFVIGKVFVPKQPASVVLIYNHPVESLILSLVIVGLAGIFYFSLRSRQRAETKRMIAYFVAVSFGLIAVFQAADIIWQIAPD